MRFWLLNRFVVTIVVVAVAVGAWNIYVANNDDGIIEGQVVGPDGAPVEGATVTLSERTLLVAQARDKATTDADGRFVFRDHRLHRLYLEADKEGEGHAGPIEYRLYFKGENMVLEEAAEAAGAVRHMSSPAGDAARPLVIFDPFPRSRALIFTDDVWERLNAAARVVSHEGERMPDAMVEEHVGEAALILGQTDLPRERLERAAKLKAIINVEGNFLPNVDYATCFQRGIKVLGVAPAFAVPVAEMGIAFALDLCRGVTAADRAFRAGEEQYGLAGNMDSFMLSGCEIGLVGFGNLGQALLPLLQPFRPKAIRVFDPWLPEGYLRDFGLMPAPLDEVLGASRVTFVLAGVTQENRGMIGAREFALIPDGAAFVLLSRADIVDWDAFMAATKDGRIRAATDVFPQEPAPADEPARRNPHVLLSAHRAGGLRQALYRIGEIAVDDALLILRGLPPVRLQAARAETVGRMRSKPGRSYKPGEVT